MTAPIIVANFQYEKGLKMHKTCARCTVLLALLFLWFAAVPSGQAQEWPEDAAVEAGDAFSGLHVTNAWIGARSFIALWNPPASGKNIYLDAVALSHTNTAADGVDMRHITTSTGTLRDHGRNKRLGWAASVAEIRWGNAYASAFSAMPILREAWTGTRYDDHQYQLRGSYLLEPGNGVIVISANDNIGLIVTFDWRQKAIP